MDWESFFYHPFVTLPDFIVELIELQVAEWQIDTIFGKAYAIPIHFQNI